MIHYAPIHHTQFHHYEHPYYTHPIHHEHPYSHILTTHILTTLTIIIQLHTMYNITITDIKPDISGFFLIIYKELFFNQTVFSNGIEVEQQEIP